LQGAPTYWGDQPFTGGPSTGGRFLVFLWAIFWEFWAARKESIDHLWHLFMFRFAFLGQKF